MTAGPWLIDTCCCESVTPSDGCISAAVIGSCYGLITDPDCGIKPIVGEYQVLVQQAPGYSSSFECSTGFGLPCTITHTTTAAAPRQATYRLRGGVDGLPPCYWIWYSKARSLAFDLNFPSTNRCCCQGQYYAYGCENANTVPCSTPVECFCDVMSSSHGGGTDSICVGSGSGCASVGTYDYERDGVGGIIAPGQYNNGGNWFTTKYPAATPAEEADDNWASPININRSNAGLSAYQLRVAQGAYQWTWEINQFNDGLPIKVNGTSYAYRTPAGSVGTAYKYYGSDPSVTNQDSAGGHPLFRYFNGFAHAEFAYLKVVNFPVTPGTSETLWQMTTPYKFYFAADGVPVFSFEFDTAQNSSLFPPEMYEPASPPSADFYADAQDVDAMFKDSAFTSRMSAKDWRGEVIDDLGIVDAWGQAQTPPYTAAEDLLAQFPDAASLKMMFPIRLPGDQWDLRALDPSTGATTADRPPSLARVASQTASGLDESYDDSVLRTRTGQVDSTIYDMAEPPGGIASMTTAAANAFKRLTRSVYFRACPAGWDWSVAAMESDPARKPRYCWLLDRQQGSCNYNEALRWSCVVSVDAPCTTDNVWCPTGKPQQSVTGGSCAPGVACLNSVCDLRYGHGGYSGNVNILVARGEFPHQYDDETSCCAPVPLSHHASSTPTHETSNLCFFRHAGRTYYWDTSAAPYSMQLVSGLSPAVHPIDGASTCGPFPPIATQNESGGGPASFCGHMSDTDAVANCGGGACSEYSYAVVLPDAGSDQCDEIITTEQSVTRPAGSIAGQRNAPYIGFSSCLVADPIEDTTCICPGDCAHLYPVVVATAEPE